MSKTHKMKALFLIRGLPGSGKSTLAKIIAGDDHPIFEADKFFELSGEYKFDPSKLKTAHQWCLNNAESYMKSSIGCSYFDLKLVVSNTFTQEWEMKPYFDIAKKYGYTVFTIIVENRHGNKSVHNVPDDSIEKMKNRFEINL